MTFTSVFGKFIIFGAFKLIFELVNKCKCNVTWLISYNCQNYFYKETGWNVYKIKFPCFYIKWIKNRAKYTYFWKLLIIKRISIMFMKQLWNA